MTSIRRRMTGVLFPVRRRFGLYLLVHVLLSLPTDTMADHRAKSLNALLSIALATGYSEIDPELEPLKVHIDS